MALVTPNFTPATSLVFGARDFSKDMRQNQAEDTKGLQNAFKFGTQVYDYIKQRQIADAIKNGDADKAAMLDAQRINTQDPTSMFRWKAGQEQAKQIHDENLAAQKEQRAQDLARIEAEKQKTKDEQKLHVQNKLDSYLPTMAVGLNTSPEQAQQFLNTLAGLETEASNYGIDDPRIAEMKARLSGDLPYNQMMAAMDELEDIDANFGKGPDYDRMNAEQKFKVYQRKLEDARQQIMDNNPELWDMMMRDRRYNKKLTTLMSNRRPKSKGTAPARPSTRK